MKRYVIFIMFVFIYFSFTISKAELKPVVQIGHSEDVIYIENTDKNFFISAQSTGKIKLWDKESGKLIKTIDIGLEYISSVSYNPYSNTLLVATLGNIDREGKVSLWNIKTGKSNKIIYKSEAFFSKFSKNGKYLVIATNKNEIIIYNAYQYTPIFSITTNKAINSITFSPDSKYILFSKDEGIINIINIKTHKIEKQIKVGNNRINSINISPDGKYLSILSNFKIIKVFSLIDNKEIFKYISSNYKIFSISFDSTGDYLIFGGEKGKLYLFSLRHKKVNSIVKTTLKTIKSIAFDSRNDIIIIGGSFYTLTSNIQNLNNIEIWDFKSFKSLKKIRVSLTFNFDFKIDINDENFYLKISQKGCFEIYKKDNNKLLAEIYQFPDASVVITPKGYFSGTGNYQDYVHFVDTETLKVYTLDQYYETFYRPDLVKLALKGEDISNIAKNNINNVKPAPEVLIVEAPNKTNKNYTDIKIKIIDQGGGIGDTVIFLNGTAVKSDNTRAIKRLNSKKVVYQTYRIPLTNGKNILEVKVYNQEKTQISKPARHIVYANISNTEKPNLYAVIIGINEYRTKIRLKYAVNDAIVLSKTLKETAENSGLYGKVEIITLTKKEETDKETILNTLKEVSKKVKPKDVFIFAVSSHGTVMDGKYYLITSNVGYLSPHKLEKDALTQDEIKNALSNILATKKIVMLDTCNSGKIANELQYALLTRGLDEETALNILSKSTGVAILSASTEIQYALEGYKGHGIFSYVVIEGLKGKADLNRDRYITISEFGAYVEDTVREIAKEVFNREQFPYFNKAGLYFPIVKINNN